MYVCSMYLYMYMHIYDVDMHACMRVSIEGRR
jgi:hypothetical protein